MQHDLKTLHVLEGLVSIYYRLDMACNIMTFFSTPGTTLYDRRKIVRLK